MSYDPWEEFAKELAERDAREPFLDEPEMDEVAEMDMVARLEASIKAKLVCQRCKARLLFFDTREEFLDVLRGNGWCNLCRPKPDEPDDVQF